MFSYGNFLLCKLSTYTKAKQISKQRSKVMSISPGLVDFPIRQTDSSGNLQGKPKQDFFRVFFSWTQNSYRQSETEVQLVARSQSYTSRILTLVEPWRCFMKQTDSAIVQWKLTEFVAVSLWNHETIHLEKLSKHQVFQTSTFFLFDGRKTKFLCKTNSTCWYFCCVIVWSTAVRAPLEYGENF